MDKDMHKKPKTRNPVAGNMMHYNRVSIITAKRGKGVYSRQNFKKFEDDE